MPVELNTIPIQGVPGLLINAWYMIKISCRSACTRFLGFLAREFWFPNVIYLAHSIREGHAWSFLRQKCASVVTSNQNMQSTALLCAYLLGNTQLISQFFEI